MSACHTVYAFSAPIIPARSSQFLLPTNLLPWVTGLHELQRADDTLHEPAGQHNLSLQRRHRFIDRHPPNLPGHYSNLD